MCESVYVGYIPIIVVSFTVDGVSSYHIIYMLRLCHICSLSCAALGGVPYHTTYIHARLTGGGLEKDCT